MMGRILTAFIECQLYARLHARIWHKGDRENRGVVKKEKEWLNSRPTHPHGHNNRKHGVLD